MAHPGAKRASSSSKAKLPGRLHRAPMMHAVGQSSTDRCDKPERRTISADATGRSNSPSHRAKPIEESPTIPPTTSTLLLRL